MKLFFISYILTLFYFVNSFAITYSECYQQQSIKNNSDKLVCNENGKCHLFFGCQCFDGFEGEECELKVEKKNGCYLNKCFEGSECVEISATRYYCECPTYRYGNFCEFEDPCFDCIGKCLEMSEDVFECDELGKRNNNTLNQSESINSTFIDVNITVPFSNVTSKNQSECIIADYCLTVADNNICDPMCNTEICNFDFNDCNSTTLYTNSSTTVSFDREESKNDEIYKYLFYLIIFCTIIITAIIFLCIGKLIVKRWKKISEEIDAENAAIRRMYVNEATYFTI